MVKVKFNKSYRDKELGRKVPADEPVEMTLKRADEIVKTIKSSNEHYKDFKYERLDKPDEKDDKTEDKDKK